MSHIVSRGHKWARFEKEYLPYFWAFDTKIWMTGEAGGDLSVRKGILKYSNFWLGPSKKSFSIYIIYHPLFSQQPNTFKSYIFQTASILLVVLQFDKICTPLPPWRIKSNID